MMQTYDEDGQPNLSNKKMLQMLLKGIPLLHKELREDIEKLDQKLGRRIDAVESEVKNLRLEVHQNHISFIINQEECAKRVAVLEAR